ncbi:MAG: 2-dehydro-3-deoxygalactonokinase [Desulfobacterales bacterium]|jgi:2-dehydro-3-deoxygalactonokinase
MPKPVLISADWGTTSLRAFLLDRQGAIVDRREAPKGIMKVLDGDFSGTFSALTGRWLNDYPEVPVLFSGMIGSEQGWAVAPHIPLPARLADLAGALHAVPITDKKYAYIVPGLTTVGAHGVHDIIRGEETQIVGALDDPATGESVLCLPGTHSKWVTVADDVISGFQTCLTGEALAILSENSILGRLMENSVAENENKEQTAFVQGLTRATERGGLLHHLFGVRSQGYCRVIPRTGLRLYLAGILIGHEIQGMREIYPQLKSITIIAGQEIAERYDRALEFFGLQTTIVDGAAAAFGGHLKIARAAGLI